MSVGLHEEYVAVGPLEMAGLARACVGSDVCGDLFAWKVADDALTLLVADGTGHGAPAREAAARAADCVLRDEGSALERTMRSCHDALVRTRGAALALIRVELATGLVAFCGVGNIGFRDLPRRGGRGASLPGVVGFKLPTLRVFSSRLIAGDTLVFHSDGIDAAADLDPVKGLAPRDLVRAVEARHGKPSDDATVVVLRLQGGGVQ